MIALPVLFADSAVPDGPITDAAADALAALLWATAEEETQAEADDGDQDAGE